MVASGGNIEACPQLERTINAVSGSSQCDIHQQLLCLPPYRPFVRELPGLWITLFFLVLGVAAIIDVAGPCTSADQRLYVGIGW